jgi:hypothetical protein
MNPSIVPEEASGRRGQIARLPHNIRQEINRRLQDGEEAKKLADWLNSLSPIPFRGAYAPSRVAIGALADGFPLSQKMRLARAPTAAREGACAPRKGLNDSELATGFTFQQAG